MLSIVAVTGEGANTLTVAGPLTVTKELRVHRVEASAALQMAAIDARIGVLSIHGGTIRHPQSTVTVETLEVLDDTCLLMGGPLVVGQALFTGSFPVVIGCHLQVICVCVCVCACAPSLRADDNSPPRPPPPLPRRLQAFRSLVDPPPILCPLFPKNERPQSIKAGHWSPVLLRSTRPAFMEQPLLNCTFP